MNDRWLQIIRDRRRFVSLMVSTRRSTAFVQHRFQSNIFRFRLSPDGVQATDFEQLSDQVVQAIEFLPHHMIKLRPLFICHRPHFQRFQIQLQRSDRRLQFVSDAVDEIRLPLIQPDFLDDQEQVERESDEDQQIGRAHV